MSLNKRQKQLEAVSEKAGCLGLSYEAAAWSLFRKENDGSGKVKVSDFPAVDSSLIANGDDLFWSRDENNNCCLFLFSPVRVLRALDNLPPMTVDWSPETYIGKALHDAFMGTMKVH